MKRILAVLLTLTAILTAVVCFSPSAAAESLYIRKIVSVVYDDSGSMYGDKWAYANYAMQAFCGMLNEDDRLFITYMSRQQSIPGYQPEAVDLSAGGIQRSVDEIRRISDSGSTPYGAVELAFDKLKTVSDQNPNTQYWLVVLTDGNFDEIGTKKQLNTKFRDYVSQTMPNGSRPQITFLGIGDDLTAPDENEKSGIFTYRAKSASDILDTMSQMASQITGRTRLAAGEVTQSGKNELTFRSTIPLLNIDVFLQDTDAKIVSLVRENEENVPVMRSANISYPGYGSLQGEITLMGTSRVLGSGNYVLTFDRDVDKKDVILLFEPAIETRMVIEVNGKQIDPETGLSGLTLTEGDKVSVYCKIYETGTDREISPSLMPPGTKYEVTIDEDGKTVKKETGTDMTVKDYVLNDVYTKITASVMIDGFRPISYYEAFTPEKYVKKTVYTITPSFGGGTKSIKADDLPSNTQMTVVFRIEADGVPMTDPTAVRALNPTVTTSLVGNDGQVTVASDGAVIFTPNRASAPAGAENGYDVEVTCAIADGTSASEKYTVLLADFQVIAVGNTLKLKKTELYDNAQGVSFYVTKDGVRLGKDDVEKNITVVLNEEHAGMNTDVTVAADGTITVVPFGEKDLPLNFGTWWINWARYFSVSGEDITVELLHPYGSASDVIDVTGETLSYMILCVWLPLLLEAAIVIYLAWWIYAILAKPKFGSDCEIWYASLTYVSNDGSPYQRLSRFRSVPLSMYNKFKYRWKPTLKPTAIWIARGLEISAAPGEAVICNGTIWFKGPVKTTNGAQLEHPSLNIADHTDIKLISPASQRTENVSTLAGPRPTIYYVSTDLRNLPVIDGVEVVDRATVFAYVREQ